MLVHILGNTPQEKGSELEELVRFILKEKGYSDLVKRYISSGGHEIDIHGQLKIPMVGDSQSIDVICECKAHGQPINTTDWLKFLGKIYLEESNTGRQASGCFISLSGVNGNVWGSYKQLKENKRQNIELVTGESLERILIGMFGEPKVVNHRSIVEQQTSRKILSSSLAYRKGEVYWVFGLNGDVFSVLDRNGRTLKPDDEIITMLREVAPGEYVDLQQEKERLDAQQNVESKIYTSLSKFDGGSTADELKDELKSLFYEDGKELSFDVFESVMSAISTFCFVDSEDGRISLKLEESSEKIAFFKRVLGVGVSQKLLSSNFYQNLFDYSFLDEIERIQCGLDIGEDNKEMCLKIIRLSPSALAVSINEIQLITQHRRSQQHALDQLEEHDRRLFLRLICESFMQDFENSLLTDFYYNHAGIEELDFNFDVKFKTKSGIHVEHQNRKRLGIGKMSDEYGGKLVRILTLDNAPEPWEHESEDKANQ